MDELNNGMIAVCSSGRRWRWQFFETLGVTDRGFDGFDCCGLAGDRRPEGGNFEIEMDFEGLFQEALLLHLIPSFRADLLVWECMEDILVTKNPNGHLRPIRQQIADM